MTMEMYGSYTTQADILRQRIFYVNEYFALRDIHRCIHAQRERIVAV